MIIQKKLKYTHSPLCHCYPMCKSLSLCTSSLKSSGLPRLTEQVVACSELLTCPYVSTGMIHLARPQQTFVDQGSWSCYLETLTITQQKEFLAAKQWLGSKRDPEAGFCTLAQLTHLLVASFIDFSSKSLSVCPFLWVMRTGGGDCGFIAQLKQLSPSCHFFQPGMCASSPTTCITFSQLPGPSTQGQYPSPTEA